MENALELAHRIVDVLDEKKGEDILLLDLQGVCSFTDAFVICTAGSARTLGSLAEEVRRKLRSSESRRPMQVEGDAESGWILLDYGEVVLHIFSADLRAFYRLEDLWSDGRTLLHIA